MPESTARPSEARDGAALFNACYETYYRAIRHFSARLLNDAAEGEELAQETFARLWAEIDAGVEILDPRPWLYRVAANLATSRLRRTLRASNQQQQIESTVRDWQTGVVDVERAAIYRELVPAVLGRLPQPMRVCLVLYHEGLTGTEMAEVLGVKPSYVGTLVLRAHERFRREYDRLGQNYGVHG